MLRGALHYLHGQWPKLIRFTENGLWPLDSNPVENAIRPFVVGRKNWLFAATPAGAQASANLYSLIEISKAHGIEPYAYLAELFIQEAASGSVRRRLRGPAALEHLQRARLVPSDLARPSPPFLARAGLIDCLPWSGGAADQGHSDPRGPDASALAWAFAQRQFAHARAAQPLRTCSKFFQAVRKA